MAMCSLLVLPKGLFDTEKHLAPSANESDAINSILRDLNVCNNEFSWSVHVKITNQYLNLMKIYFRFFDTAIDLKRSRFQNQLPTSDSMGWVTEFCSFNSSEWCNWRNQLILCKSRNILRRLSRYIGEVRCLLSLIAKRQERNGESRDELEPLSFTIESFNHKWCKIRCFEWQY